MRSVLIVTNYYLPGYKSGGPIKSISLLSEKLKKYFNISVLTSNHDSGDLIPYKDIVFNEALNLNGYDVVYLSKLTYLNFINNVRRLRPDIIYLNSFFSNLTRICLVLNSVGFINAKIVVAPRGEISSGALSINPNRKALYIRLVKMTGLIEKKIFFHATSLSEKNYIESFFRNSVTMIPNLAAKNNIVYRRAKERGMVKIVFLSRIVQKKNLIYALELLDIMKYPNIYFDIYGVIEDPEYWRKCKELIGLNNNITYKGSVTPDNVSKTLSKYHIFFLPTRNENFGHAIVEAMQSGVIPLISNQTPWSDLDNYDAGWSFSLDNKFLFKNTILEVRDYSQDEFDMKSSKTMDYINNKINNKEIVDKYIKMFS